MRRKTDGDGPCYLQADEEAVDRTLRGDRGAGVLAILGRKAELRVAVRLAKALSVLKEDVLNALEDVQLQVPTVYALR